MSMLSNNRKSNFGSNQNMVSQFMQFRREIEQSGKDPRAMLDEMVASGKVTKQQVEQAKGMAMLYKSILGGNS